MRDSYRERDQRDPALVETIHHRDVISVASGDRRLGEGPVRLAPVGMKDRGDEMGPMEPDPSGDVGEPLVSVIVPVYNVFPYLREALYSVVFQTWKNLEIIVVDDGSTDGSGEVCDEYAEKDPRVRVIHQENRGLSAARNAGLDQMAGDYVAFLDSDDAFHPEMIERLYNATVRLQADLAVCGHDIYMTEGPMVDAKSIQTFSYAQERILSGREAVMALMEEKMSMAAWNKIYSTKLRNPLRFPEGHVYEDNLVTQRVLEMSKRVVVIPESLVRYRKREGSITTTMTAQNILDCFMACRVIQENLEHVFPPYPEEYTQMIRERNIRRMIFAWAELRKRSEDLETVTSIKNELQQFAGEKNRFKSYKTRIVWELLLVCPGLILPIRNGYRFLRCSPRKNNTENEEFNRLTVESNKVFSR